MKNILVISHGVLAEGLVETAKVFFGEDLSGVEALLLKREEEAEGFRSRLIEAVDRLDEGDGVIILADLMGGTPCNQTVFLQDKNVHILAGVNLGLLMEVIAARGSDELDYDHLVETGRSSLVDFTKLLENRKRKKKEDKGD